MGPNMAGWLEEYAEQQGVAVQSALVDARYAVLQLRGHRDVGRALDALDRVVEVLERAQRAQEV